MVIPLVMYHGAQGAWTARRRVEELFPLPSTPEQAERWRALVPRFEYLVDDLTAEREEALRARPGPPLARLGLLLLRFGRAEELARRVEGWRAIWAEVITTPEGLEDLRAALHYLSALGDRMALQAARRVLHSVVSEQRDEELMKTLAQEFHEGLRRLEWLKGLEEGEAKGRAEGRAESVLRILAARGIAVDERTRQFILACPDLELLDRWFDRALTATSLLDLWGNR